ncbi:hypothetical protein BD779DRAFT_1612268 [Infundibulicybe gibba]|nr:hypothetical protein BD779DRAFT_1612268 [Infundibulicybe gibba]
MDPSLYNHWLQQQQLLPESQHVTQEARPSPTAQDEWPKERATPTSQSTGVGSPHPVVATPTIDIGDFTTLGDIAGPSSSTPALSSPSQPFYIPFQQGSFFVSSPYSTPYGTAWPSQSHLPLSNYSTTTISTTTQQQQQQTQQQQQQHASPPLQPMMIDPALTTMTTPTSNGIQNPYSQTSNYSSQSTQQRPQYQYHHLPSLATSYSLPASYYSQQNPSSSQGTLSPQALMGSIMSAPFYTTPTPQQQPQPPPKPTPQERKQKFQNGIRPLLQAQAFGGAQAVATLVDRIDAYGSQDVDAGTRLEILTKIRDGAGNHYFRAWSENPGAIDISREWLKAAFTAKSDNLLVETIMPLLHIIDRLPLTVESLKASKLGKIVVKLVKDPPSPAIKDMASNLERRWRQMVSNADGVVKAPDNNGSEDGKSKKRKSSDPPASKALPPQKKAAVGPIPTSRVTVKKEGKPVVQTAVKDAKSDMSFFSAPKVKPKLPSFKKAAPPPPQVKKEPGSNVAQPSSIDPFQEALKSMAKVRRDSPSVSTPPSTSASTPTQSGLTKTGKKKKTVTWRPDSMLESGMPTHSLRELDRGEGAALHAHLFEETIDWSEPIPLEIPADVESRPRGEGSEEKVTQEQREQTALGALYTPTQVPDSPAEPVSVISEEEVDRDVKTMTSGPDVDSVFWSGAPVLAVPPLTSVADLMGQLAAVGSVNGTDTIPGGGGPSFSAPGVDLKAAGLDPSATLSAVQSLPQEQLQQLLQQLSAPALYGQAGQVPYNGTDQAWPTPNQYPAEYGYQDDAAAADPWTSDRGRGRGRGRGGGRGRGDDGGYRHNKRKPCNFFAAGRCKYGDQCDFAHEVFS